MPSLNFLKRRRTAKHGQDDASTSTAPASPASSQPASTGRRSLSSLLHRSSVAHGHGHSNSNSKNNSSSSQQPAQAQAKPQTSPAQNGASHSPAASAVGKTSINGSASKPEPAANPSAGAHDQHNAQAQAQPQDQDGDQPMSGTDSSPITAQNNLASSSPQHDGALKPPAPASIPPSLSNQLSVAANPSPGTDPAALLTQQQQAHPKPPQPSTTVATMQTDAQQPPQPTQHEPEAAVASQARVTKGKYTLTDFDILRTLGTGSFGRVHLVQSKHNQRFYAVKVLKKAQVVKMKQVEHTNDERRMLSDVKHPFLITLWGTFQDWRNIYMVMDFVEGGELFSLLRKSGVCTSSRHWRTRLTVM